MTEREKFLFTDAIEEMAEYDMEVTADSLSNYIQSNYEVSCSSQDAAEWLAEQESKK